MHVLSSPRMLKPKRSSKNAVRFTTIAYIQKGKLGSLLTQEPQHGGKAFLRWKPDRSAEDDRWTGFLVAAATRPCPWSLHTIHLPVEESPCALHALGSTSIEKAQMYGNYYEQEYK